MEEFVCGSYRVVSKLGSGGMAEVFLARHELMGREAAVKILQPDMSARTDMIKRFVQEARAAGAIKHPGIVAVYDAGYMTDGRAYIVMEKLSGETLGARMKQEGKLELDDTLRLIRQLAGVIGAAHDAGIVHRDLKPDNIFIVPDPEVPGGERVKVLDFGLAKLTFEHTRSVLTADGAIFGTPAYMAPEQCRSSANVDGRADLYSIGCIFYRCLCGDPPFTAANHLQLLNAQLSSTPRPPSQHRPDLPVEVDQLIVRLLAKSPEARVQSCAELVAALEESAEPDSMLIATNPVHSLNEAQTIVDLGNPAQAAAAGSAFPDIGAATLVISEQEDADKTMPVATSCAATGSSPSYGRGQLAGHGAVYHPGHGRAPRRTVGMALVVSLVLVGITVGALWGGASDEDNAAIIAPPTQPNASSAVARTGEQPLNPANRTIGQPEANEAPDPADDDDIERSDDPQPSTRVTEDHGEDEDEAGVLEGEPSEQSTLTESQISDLLARTRSAYGRGDFDTASAACRKILAVDRRNLEAGLWCTLAACSRGNARRARRYYKRLDEQNRARAIQLCQNKGISLGSE